MRLIVTPLLWTASFATLVSADGQENMQTCIIGEVYETMDYFPAKVEPLSSKLWSVEYHNTYKVAANLATNKKYLLYQCGSEPPAEDPSVTYDAIIPVPVEYAGITKTPTIPNFELLGIMDKIEYYVESYEGDAQYISSPCLLDSINASDTTVTSDNSLQQDLILDAQEQDKVSNTVLFGSQYTENTAFEHFVSVEENLEDGNAAIFEWIKFYSVFFNLEHVANEAYVAAEGRHDCVKETTSAVTADAPKPVILWGYYNSYSGGWDVAADCDNKYNYYCEFADTCSATLLHSDEGSIQGYGTDMLMTTEEFVEFGKDADHWIFPSTDWDSVYANYKDDLDTFKSVQNGQVYDNMGSGGNAWFEQRLTEYYDVAQDFCHVAGTTRALEGPNWFRNVFTEEISGPGTCEEEMAGIMDGVFAYRGSCYGLEPMDEEDESSVSVRNLGFMIVMFGLIFSL